MSKRGRERGGEEDADNVSQTQTEKLQRNREGRRQRESSCSRAESEAEKVPGCGGSIQGVG